MDRGLGSRELLRRSPQLAPLTAAQRTALLRVAVARQREERRARAVIPAY